MVDLDKNRGRSATVGEHQ